MILFLQSRRATRARGSTKPSNHPTTPNEDERVTSRALIVIVFPDHCRIVSKALKE